VPRSCSGAFLALGLLLAAACARERVVQPDVVLVTLDTTRADRLSTYGYPRATSPNLDALAEDAVVFERAWAPSSWTLPSHASLFTGRVPSGHGARYDPEGSLVLDRGLEQKIPEGFRAEGLDPDARTLAELLSGAGYAAAGFVAGPWMKELFGLGRGFGHWDDEGIERVRGRLGGDVTDAAIAWLEDRFAEDARAGGRTPFFLFANYYDPHGPYLPPTTHRWLFAAPPPPGVPLRKTPKRVAALYDAEIRYADDQLGRLLDFLRQHGRYEDAIVIVTSDHGELFGENGRFGHGAFLSEEELRIPLVVKYPSSDRKRGRTDAPASLVDVLPLLAERLDLSLPGPVEGAVPGAERPIVAEAYPIEEVSASGHWRAFLDGDWKYVWSSTGSHALYDLREEPREAHNRLDDEAERASEMAARLDAYLASVPRPTRRGPAQAVDEETRRALEGLGYLEPGVGEGEQPEPPATP
jgi:arylsulfatase A-like enzyme